MVDKVSFVMYNVFRVKEVIKTNICRYDEIGRHERLKISRQ